SSLRIEPASSFPFYAQWINKRMEKLERGRVVIINLQKTEYDERCDLRFFTRSDRVFRDLFEQLGITIEGRPLIKPDLLTDPALYESYHRVRDKTSVSQLPAGRTRVLTALVHVSTQPMMGTPELLHGSYAGTPWGYDSAIDELRHFKVAMATMMVILSGIIIFLLLVASIDAEPRKPLDTKTARQPRQRERITHIEMDDAVARRREFDAELDREELACIVKANFPTAESGKERYRSSSEDIRLPSINYMRKYPPFRRKHKPVPSLNVE
ncbi:NAD-dependent protein deacetylase sirtuin-6, partial [Perkinsus olseni]